MVRKTKEEAQVTRHRILDTAEVVFAEKGVSRTTLNDIAAAAELTRGAIYWHFKNKADLFDAMLKRVTLPIDEFMLSEEAKPRGSGLDNIRSTTLRVVKTLVENPRTQRVFDILMHKSELVDELSPIHGQHLEGRDNCIQKMRADLQLAIDQGELPSHVDPDQAAVCLHSLIDGMFVNWVLCPNEFDLVEQARFGLDVYIAGLKANKPGGV